jgi:shikimate 5-dehydrogenase
LNFAKELLIQGVAVTMPLKEEIVKYVDVQCAEPSINTLVLKNDNYKGYNLDVIACYELIKEKRSIKDKSIYILGSGGVGASLACFFKDKEAIITIFNRDERRGLKAAKSSSAKFCRYDQFDGCCDVLIQTTSVGMAPNFEASIIETNLIKPTSLVIEFISNPKETLFLRGAKERGCDTIDGDLILEKISYLQQKLWKISSHTCCHC